MPKLGAFGSVSTYGRNRVFMSTGAELYYCRFFLGPRSVRQRK